MSNTLISKMQVRSGFESDLPTLDQGELGWCADTRRLFIGNGTQAEGAPIDGNTEIFTEYANLDKLFDANLQRVSEKGQPDGYAGLDNAGKIDAFQIPSIFQLLSQKGQANGYVGLDSSTKINPNRMYRTKSFFMAQI